MENDIRQIIAAAHTKARPGKFPLYEWLSARFEILTPTLKQRGVNWDGMAVEIGRLGIKDGKGNALSGMTVSQTWYKVRRDKIGKKRRARPLKSARPLKPAFQRTARQ